MGCPGQAFQELSIKTGGYRYPVCASDYTDMFTLMSQSVITGANVPCGFELPTPDNGEDLDLATVEMTYRQGGTDEIRFSQVASLADCNEQGFLIQDGRLSLCPDTCARVENDPDAKLNTLFGCTLDIR